MASKNGALKKEIWKWLKDMQVIYLATMHGKKPQVRPVTVIRFKNRFWLMTGTRDAKVKQIKKNAFVQFCLPIARGKHHGSIRVDCRARIVKDKKTRHLLAKNVYFFRYYWKTPDEPTYTLIELVMKQIEYMKPGKMITEKISI